MKKTETATVGRPIVVTLIVIALRISAVGMFFVFWLASTLGVGPGYTAKDEAFGLLLGVASVAVLWIVSNYLAKMKIWTLYVIMAILAFLQYFLIMTWISEPHPDNLATWIWWYLLGTAVIVGLAVYFLTLRKKFR